MLPPASRHVRSGLRIAHLSVSATLVASLGTAFAQTPRLVQPGAPGEPTREITAEQASDTSAVRHTAADTRFMQGMLGHHAQALDMTALVADRARSDAVKTLARRIEVSQQDEMAMMREWLTRRGEVLPARHAHHHGRELRPGLLADAQMEALAAARGPAFDRLFLEGMIQHHAGALTMVRELFGAPGGGQEPEIFDFASEVEADQAMEIARMRALLEELR